MSMSTLANSPSRVNVPSLESLTINFQGALVQAKCKLADPLTRSGGGRRGAVNEFSAGSRRRLMQLFARLLVGVMNPAIFITLTYPVDFPSPLQAKKHRRAFEARLARFAPGCSAIWRMEFQKRGAPHFHLVCFNLPFLPKELVQKWWGEIIGYATPFTRIEMIRDGRKLVNYVSKYVAKLPEAGGFNLLTYLHGNQFIHPVTGEICGSVGRWWGVMNEAGLPFAPLTSIQISGGDFKGFYNFRRGARHAFRQVSRRPCQGFALFVGNADRWRDYWFGVVCGAA